MATNISGSNIQETVIDLTDGENGSTLPAPVDLHVKQLNYAVTDRPGTWWQKITHLQMPWEWFEKGTPNTVLQDVSFTAKSGQLMAIMGGSGSGKTSLLDIISCRTSNGTITGEVYLNSAIRTQTLLDTCSGYVRQDDRLIGSLTARETLMFVARLKLPRTFTTDMIKHRVNMIIAELGLRHAAETKVGGADIRGLSGGERRRVSIGIQLLILPGILFLDEPTSGLDSFTARNLVKTLSRLAAKRRTIIMSIHQPGFDIFSLVDALMILSAGRIVYNGPGKEIVSYFTTLGFPCPPHTNPCDFCVDLATVDYTSKEREESSLKNVQTLHDAYKATEKTIEITENRQIDKSSNTSITSNNGDDMMTVGKICATKFPHPLAWRVIRVSPAVESDDNGSRQADVDNLQTSSSIREDERRGPNPITQFYILFKRFIRVKADNYIVLINHVVQAILMSLLLGIVYIDLKQNTLAIRDWLSLLSIVCIFYPFMIMLGVIGTCYEERRYLYFELQDRLYSPAAYYFAKLSSELPFHLVYVLVYCIPFYAMVGLSADSYTCFLFYVYVSVSVFTSRSLAMMAAAIMPTYQIACILAQSIFSLFIMGAGFFINLDSMIQETRWLSVISYLRWSYESLCIIEIENLEFQCNTSNVCGTDLIIHGSEVLKVYAIGDVELWKCFLGLLVPMLVFLIIMFVGLKYISQKPINE